MRVLLLIVVSLSAASAALTIFQLKKKLSKAQCEPDEEHEENIVPCYNFRTKKLIGPEDCGGKASLHCCVYKCSCVVRGAGTTKGIIPEQFQIDIASDPPARKAAIKARLVKGCVVDQPHVSTNASTRKTKQTTRAPAPQRGLKSRTKQTQTGRKQLKSTAKPKSMPGKRRQKATPTSKRSGRRTTTIKPRRPKNTVRTTTPCEAEPQNAAFGFFSIFSGLMSNFGFNSEIVCT